MLQWLRSGAAPARTKPTEDTDRQIQEFVLEANRSPDMSARARVYNRAGDFCIGADRVKAALEFYGRAMDAYLHTGALDPAAAMCRKLLRYAPGAVRVHCTLACILIQDGDLANARAEIDNYIAGSRKSATEKLTVTRLRLVASAVEDREMRAFIAGRIHEMDETASRRLADDPGQTGLDGPVQWLHEVHGQWEKLLHAATLDANELWKHS